MKIWQLLDSPEKWTQKYSAIDELGNPSLPIEPRTCAWCLSGALVRCYSGKEEWFSVRRKILIELDKKMPLAGIASWNDHPDRKWQDVFDLVCKLDV